MWTAIGFVGVLSFSSVRDSALFSYSKSCLGPKFTLEIMLNMLHVPDLYINGSICRQNGKLANVKLIHSLRNVTDRFVL